MQTNHPNSKIHLTASIVRRQVLGWAALMFACAPLAGQAVTCNYSVSAPPGYSMIANHCDAVGGNTLNNVLPGVPNGCQIIKWNNATQAWEPTATFSSGSWSPNPTLNPGGGAFFFNPTAAAITLSFSGNPHTPVLPLSLPANGFCIVSRQTPQPGGFDDIVGVPPEEGDCAFRYQPVTQNYISYIFVFGDWTDSFGNQIAPVANVGESIWICRGASGAPPNFPNPPISQACSFTQGFYGNAKGKFNGTPSLTLVGNLLAQGTLVVGKTGSRSLSIQPGDASLLQLRMPSGGTAATLPANANLTLQSALLPLNSKNKLDNVLLGQTITLSLNVRLDPNLLNFQLPASFCSQGVLPGQDGLRGTPDDTLVAGDILMFSIPASVLTALSDAGLGILNGKVQGLLELANRGLAGLPTGGATLTDINMAVDAINRGFDACRVLVDCTTGMVIQDSFNNGFMNSPTLGSGGGGLAADELASPDARAPAGAGHAENVRARVSNLQASKEPGEPDHAGNAGGKSLWWRWRAPRSGPVLLQTAGSSFDTLLAVYTGTDLSNLVVVAGNDDTADGVSAEVTFQAQAGTEYQIAVDGFERGCGTIVLSLIIDRPRVCLPLVRTGNQMEVCVDGQMGRIYTVEASSDLTNWTPLASLRNTDGVLRFTDPDANNTGQRFYRVMEEF